MKSQPANANGHRRRQTRAQVLATETHCALCGGEVDKNLTFEWGKHSPRCRSESCPGCVPHPMRGEVDEITPRSRGGSAIDRDNTRLVHRKCNLDRALALAGHRPTVERDQYPIAGRY